MKCIFTIVFIIAASTEAHLLHGRSGSLQISGSYQAHPLFANHPLLANHPYLSGSKPTTEAVPAAIDNTITESTSLDSPTGTNGNIQGSFHSNVDIGRVVNDLVGVNVILLKHFQKGISERLDRHIDRLEKFEKHVDNHFSKNSAGGLNGNTNANTNKNDDGTSIHFDGNFNINHGQKGSSAPSGDSIGLSNTDSVSGSFGDFGHSSSGDFEVADPNLDAFKSIDTSGSGSSVPNCEHH